MAFSRLIPSCDWSSIFDISPRLSDQYFGMGLLEDDFGTPSIGYYSLRPRRQQMNRQRGSGISDVRVENNRFLISLDVSHFKPGEIAVKTMDNSVVVHGKHEEKQDEHGYITREFTRRYMLPPDVVPESVTSSLTSDGFLLVEAPKIALEASKPNERVVPITMKEATAISSSVADKSPKSMEVETSK